MIISPEENGVIDENLQKSKNAVTLNYAESERLRELADVKKYELFEINKQLVDSTEQLRISVVTIDKNNAKILEQNDAVDALILKIADLSKQDIEITKIVADKSSKLHDREDAVATKEAALAEAIRVHSIDRAEHEKRASISARKEEKIKEFANTL